MRQHAPGKNLVSSLSTQISHPEPARFCEVPVALPLPEDIEYIRLCVANIQIA